MMNGRSSEVIERLESMAVHVQAMLEWQAQGAIVFDYGNNLRQRAFDNGLQEAFSYPGFVPAYIRPLFCRGVGPFRWCALSGDPEDIYKTDQKVKELIPDDPHLHNWLDMARERIHFQGLPARICWLGYGERHLAGLRFLVAMGVGGEWAVASSLVFEEFPRRARAHPRAVPSLLYRGRGPRAGLRGGARLSLCPHAWRNWRRNC